jgi:ferritin-like metal-binding protein YciE
LSAYNKLIITCIRFVEKNYVSVNKQTCTITSSFKMANMEKLEQKLGEVLGLEMAAQKAVEELSAKGLLDEAGVKTQVEGMKQEANNHQKQIEELVDTLSQSEGLDSQRVQESAKETQQKASEMMHIYLGEDPDPSEAIDFLGLAEGGEVLHYEALNTMAQSLGNTQSSDTVKSILEEEKKHLMNCIQLVRQNASSSS